MTSPLDNMEDTILSLDPKHFIRKLTTKDLSLKDLAHPDGLRDSMPSIRQYSLGKTKGRCGYCGVRLAKYDPEKRAWKFSKGDVAADHIYPAARATPCMIGSLIVTCKRCNSMKQDADVVEFLSILHECFPEEELFISDLDEHLDFIKTNFIDRFVERTPDQILDLMMGDGKLTFDDLKMMAKLDGDPSLRVFTQEKQEQLFAESLRRKIVLDRNIARRALPLYERKTRRLGDEEGKSEKNKYFSFENMAVWLDDISVNSESALKMYEPDDPQMTLAERVQEFIRPVLHGIDRKLDKVNQKYEYRKKHANGVKIQNQASNTYSKYRRCWSLLMRCWAETLSSQTVLTKHDQDLLELALNAVLPPNKTQFDIYKSLPDTVDPLSKLQYLATTCYDYDDDADFDLGSDELDDVTGLYDWLPNDYAEIKEAYEDSTSGMNTVRGKNYNYKVAVWSTLKDSIFTRMLMNFGDLVDKDGNLSRDAFKEALQDMLREEVYTSEQDGIMALPPSSMDAARKRANNTLRGAAILSKIVLGEDATGRNQLINSMIDSGPHIEEEPVTHHVNEVVVEDVKSGDVVAGVKPSGDGGMVDLLRENARLRDEIHELKGIIRQLKINNVMGRSDVDAEEKLRLVAEITMDED